MSLRWQQPVLKALALFLVLSTLPVYTLATFNVRSISTNGEVTHLKKVQAVFGKLATPGNKPIKVNGNLVLPGTTILSGASIETPRDINVGAFSVLMEPLGRLDIAPDTDLKLTFNEGGIEVNLVKGCIILNTEAGTKGTVKTPQGSTETVDPERRSFIDICTSEESGAAAPIIGQGAAAQALGGAYCIVLPVAQNAKGFPFWLLLGGVPFVAPLIDQNNDDGGPAGRPAPLSGFTP